MDLDEETIVVGTPQSSGLGHGTGAVQVFLKSDEKWYESAVIGASDGQRYLELGESVPIDNSTVVSGSFL